MQETLKTNILMDLSANFSQSNLLMIGNVLMKHLVHYDVRKLSTEITLYNNEYPIEVSQFLMCKRLKGLTKASINHYRYTLNHFIGSITKDVKDIGTNDIRLYLLHCENSGNVSKSYLDDKRRVLNSFYSWMVKESYITCNPMIRIDAIKTERKLRVALTPLELEHVRNSTATYRESALLELLYSTGCRVSEIVALNRADIDFQNAMVKVCGKGNKERYCFLNAKSQVALKRYIFSRSDDSSALFVSSKKPHNRIGKGTIEKEIKMLGVRSGISKNLFPHLIRHTTATHMLRNGASLADVQAVLGHESPQTTQIYAKQDIHNLHIVHQRCVI